MESGVDRSSHLRYVTSAAQELVHFLRSDERTGNGIAVFYHQQLRMRAPPSITFTRPRVQTYSSFSIPRRSGVAASG